MNNNGISYQNYLVPIDTLRVLAVFLVFIEHWLPLSFDYRLFSPAYWGVRLFFVISGFLITGILIDNKLEAEGGKKHIEI